MTCSIKHLTIMVSSYGTALLTTVDRQGNELTILKEKPSNETYRKYYCSNCRTTWVGEEPEHWQPVIDHIGTTPETFDIPIKSEIIDLNDIDINDPNMRPTVKKLVKPILEVFGEDNA